MEQEKKKTKRPPRDRFGRTQDDYVKTEAEKERERQAKEPKPHVGQPNQD